MTLPDDRVILLEIFLVQNLLALLIGPDGEVDLPQLVGEVTELPLAVLAVAAYATYKLT